MLSARLRAGPSANVVVMIDRPAGAVNAALTPLMKRVAMSSAPSFASPPRPEATMNTPSEMRNMRRRPSRSAARPPRSRKPPYPSTYALTTHCSELVDMCRSVRIEGRATPIIETSRASRKSAPQSTRSAPQARGLSRSVALSKVVAWRVMVDKKAAPLRGPGLGGIGTFGYCSIRIIHTCSIQVEQLRHATRDSETCVDLAEVAVLTVL